MIYFVIIMTALNIIGAIANISEDKVGEGLVNLALAIWGIVCITIYYVS